MTKKQKAYLSGPITNDPEFIKHFTEAEKRYSKLYNVVSPVRLSIDYAEKVGIPIAEIKWGTFMKMDLEVIDDCEVIIMLENWKASPGAKIELIYAQKLGLKVIYDRGEKADVLKPDWSLVNMKLLEGMVRVLMFGEEKYARDNWKYVPDAERRYKAAACRHLGDVITKLDSADEESGLPSLDHALCCLYFLRYFLKEERS